MLSPFDTGDPVPDIEAQSFTPPAEAVARPDHRDASDGELMHWIGLGDRDAFNVFCRRHAGRCLSIAQHLLRNEADAEEAVQDAFMRVWQNAARWKMTGAQVTTWLYRVVVNLALDQMRKATRLSVSIEHAAEVIATDPNPESLVGQRELAKVIVRAVADLPPRQRAALSLVICEDIECAEAAKIMGVTVGTMESLLVRGRRHLRAALLEADQERARSSAREPAERPDGVEMQLTAAALSTAGV